MSDVLKKIRDFMEKEGIPGRDAYDLPSSNKNFAADIDQLKEGITRIRRRVEALKS